MPNYFGTYFGDYFGTFFDASESTIVVKHPLYELFKNTWQSFADITNISYVDSTSSVASAKARKCIPEQKELDRIATEYDANADYATFVAWDVTFDGVRPKANGKITWIDGTTWTIRSLFNEHFETQWRCLCIKDL